MQQGLVLPDVHLCLVQPLGYVHSLGFIDQARYFRHQFRRMGAQVTVAKNRLRHDAVNFVFGAHLGFDPGLRERYSCIFVNLEQLGQGGAQVNAGYLELLRRSAVVDYDADNLAAYAQDASEVPVLPFGHAPYLAPASPLPLEERPIDLLFYGDPQVYDSPGQWATTLQLSTARVPEASVLVVAGDWVDGDSPEKQWPQWDMVLAPPQLAEVAVAPTLGNHDDAGGPTYAEHFATPNSGAVGETVPGSGDYWFRRGSVLLVDLNTNDLDAAAHGAFLKAAVAANPDARWRVVAFHQAPFSGDGHYADANVVRLRNELAPLLSRAQVDLVLNGHDHSYTRSLLVDGVTPVPGSDGARLSPEPGQVLYVTANSASGTKFYPLTRSLPWVARAVQDLVPAYTAVHATDAALTVTTRRISDDSVVDEVTLER